MLIKRVDVQPVVKGGLRLQRKVYILESEPSKRAGFLQAGIALRVPRILDAVKVGERSPAGKDLAALKSHFQWHHTETTMHLEIKGAQTLPDPLPGFRRDLQQRSVAGARRGLMQADDVLLLLRWREARMPCQPNWNLFNQLGTAGHRDEDRSLSHWEDSL